MPPTKAIDDLYTMLVWPLTYRCIRLTRPCCYIRWARCLRGGFLQWLVPPASEGNPSASVINAYSKMTRPSLYLKIDREREIARVRENSTVILYSVPVPCTVLLYGVVWCVLTSASHLLRIRTSNRAWPHSSCTWHRAPCGGQWASPFPELHWRSSWRHAWRDKHVL